MNALRYDDCGVSIDAGNELVSRIKQIAKDTHDSNVLGGLGGFGALYELPIGQYRNPVLVSASDGVGTKLKLAVQMGCFDGTGIDLVAMCVNDIVTCGAKPIYFLDYFATGALDVEQAERVITGIARGCTLAGCSLIGGETAEMPGMYTRSEYDLAGFSVGIAEKENLIAPTRVQVGDCLLGLGSSGPHANGFSLIRKILEISQADLAAPLADSGSSESLGDLLLTPTRIYVKPLLRLLTEVRVSAICHITGGGLIENPPRVLPHGTVAEICRSNWLLPPIFTWLQRHGNLDPMEMLRTFNCGIGMLIAVRAADLKRTIELLEEEGETVFPLGQVAASTGPPRVVILD